MSVSADTSSDGTIASFRRRWITPITASLALFVLTTALLWPIQARLNQEHLIFIYFVPTSLIAIRYGSISALGVTLVSAAAAAYLLYPPRFSFLVTNPIDVVEILLFCLLAMLASKVVAGFANDHEIALRRSGAILMSRPWLLIADLWERVRLR